MKFEKIEIFNFKNALRGMRNPLNSWDRIDSSFGVGTLEEFRNEIDKYPLELKTYLTNNGLINKIGNQYEWAIIGPNDIKTSTNLVKAGPEHRKFLRQIFVTVDITAPLYWQNSFCQ